MKPYYAGTGSLHSTLLKGRWRGNARGSTSGLVFRAPVISEQLHINPHHRSVNVDAVISYSPVRLAIALRQIEIRYMHEVQTGRNTVARTEVVPHSTPHVHGKCQVFALRVLHSCGPF